jgi:hypothetical protein
MLPTHPLAVQALLTQTEPMHSLLTQMLPQQKLAPQTLSTQKLTGWTLTGPPPAGSSTVCGVADSHPARVASSLAL